MNSIITPIKDSIKLVRFGKMLFMHWRKNLSHYNKIIRFLTYFHKQNFKFYPTLSGDNKGRKTKTRTTNRTPTHPPSHTHIYETS